jgi:hypothetical protein
MTLADAQASPLYTLLQGKLGEPSSCSIKMNSGNEVLAVMFAHGAELTFTINAAAELSEDEVVLPAGSATVSRDEAVQALKAVEKDNAPDGMGVKWSVLMVPAPSGDVELTAEGKSCNAKARVKFSGGAVVGLGFSSAC